VTQAAGRHRETVRKRTVQTSTELTVEEAQIARLALSVRRAGTSFPPL
jgi:hypothetical protein